MMNRRSISTTRSDGCNKTAYDCGMRRVALLTLLFAVAVMADDSPLVQAAKDSKRGKVKSKSVVITNATLATKGGHLTTSTAQAPLPAAKAAPAAAPKKAAAPKNAEKKAAAPEPVEDALAPNPEDRDPENIHDPGTNAQIPPQVAAEPQLS